jgi:hypothetical protein
MSRHASTLALVLLAALGLVAGAAIMSPRALALSRDDLMKTSLIALQAGVEKSGAARVFAYPSSTAVRPGRDFPIAFWPRDPWTGRRITPGTTRGHYTYVRADDTRSYVLTAYLSGGRTFIVRGSMAHTPRLAFDHRGEEGLNLIFQYVLMWSRAHDGRLPVAEEVARNGGVGRQAGMLLWPSNPWDHRLMEQRPDHGSFAYARSAGGDAFTLTLHSSLGPEYVLHGKAAVMTAGDRP